MTPIARSFVILSLALAGCSGPAKEPPLKGAHIGGPFTLTDQNGHTVRDSDFAGRYPLIYFGYSYCPDVCPTDLQAIGQAMRMFEKQAPARAAKVQPIFITVDPERDTPAVLKSYVAAFHPRLIGLTGTADQTAEVRSEFAIFASTQPTGKAGEYLVNHSRMAFLFGPDDQPITLVPQDQGPKAIVETLEEWVR